MIDFKIEIKEKHKSQQRTKLSENLHKHVHAEILKWAFVSFWI